MPDNLPPSDDPFAGIDPQMSGVAPATDDPFGDAPPLSGHTTTGLGAATAHATRGVLPTAGGMVGAGAGAEIGAPIGAAIGSAVFPGPGTAVGAAIGGVAGGIGGFFGGSWLTGKVQDYAIGQMPDAWQDTLGQSEQAQRAQEAQHPVYSFLGGAAPYLLTMTPGALTTKALNLPADATAFQRIMANPITGRLFNGAAMGGMELGQEELDGESPDWTRVGISTGLGFFLNKPTQFGEYLTHSGAGPAYAAMAPVRNAAAGIYMLRSPLDIPREGVLNPTEPTVAQAADLGVMGAGITESTHTGGTEQSDATKANAQTEAANEQATLGPLPTPDLDAIARRIEPDLFTQRDALLERADSLRQFIDAESNPTPEMFDDLASKQSQVEAALGAANPRSPDAANYRAQLTDIETQRQDLTRRQDAWGSENYTELPEVMMARQHLADTNRDLLDLGPTIAAARRRAADHAGVPEEPAAEVPTAEPIPAATPTAPEPGGIPAPQQEVPKSLADQRAFITADRTAQLVAAGMPRNQAEANAHIEAAYYETLSQRFGGRIGTPEELYRERSARVIGPNGEAPLPPTPVSKTASAPPIPAVRQPETVGAPTQVTGDGGAQVSPEPAVETSESTPAPEPGLGPRPRIRTATEIAKEEGIPATKANGPKILAIQEKDIAALADWQARQREMERPVEAVQQAPPPASEAPPVLRSEAQIIQQDGVTASVARETWEREVQALAAWQDAHPQPVRPKRVRAPLLPTAAEPALPAHTETSGNGGLESLDPANIGVDADRFQFKSGANEAGVTDRLQGVQTWDPRLAGTALVFRDADGKNWIADGHQRLALAQRLAAEGQPGIRLNAFVLDAKDGISDADARSVAAAKNIAEGSGTALDAAKVIRQSAETGIELPPLPPRSTLVRDGRALARLGPDAFGMAVNDVVPIAQATAVGRLVSDHAQQAEAMRVLAKAKPENARQAELIIRDMLESGTENAVIQGGLFGDEHLATSAVLERAKVADEAMRQLTRDRTTFRTLVNESDRIQSHGANTLDLEANQIRLSGDEQAKQLLTQLATRKGPVSDALTGIARRLKSSDISAAAGAREFLAVIRSHVEGELGTGADAGRTIAGAAGERELTQTGPATDLLGRPIAEPVTRTAEPTIRSDERQIGIPGTEASARQAQAARDAEGPREGQKPTDEGLFAPPEKDQQSLFQRASAAIQGRIRIMAGDVRSIITLARTSDASTFMHETGHDWLKQLMQDSQHALAPDELKADAATVRRWLKRPDGWTGFKANGAPDAAPQEKFARGFEQYLREGVAPSPGLAHVFQQFKSWLTTIYRTLKGLGAPISDDIRSVFDRMLATEPQRTTFAEEGERQPSLAAIHETDAAETEPPQAEAVRDRVVAERDQRITEQKPEITDELGAASPAADEPSGEVGAGSEGPSEVAGGGGEPEPVTRGSGSGAGSGEVEPGGGNAVSKGTELPSGSARRAGEQRPLPGSASGPEQVAPKPADRFPDETESAAVDLAGNVRIQNIDDSEGFIIAATDSAERNNKYLAVRGQTTMGAMLDLANAMSMNPADVTEEHLGKLFGGVEDLGPKIWALRDIISQQGNAVHDLWVKAATSLAPADLAAATTEMARFDMMMTTLSRVTAIQGRNLGMSFRNMKDWQKAKDLNQFMKDNTGKDLFQLSVIAKLGAKMDTPAKVAKLIRDGEKRSYGRMILEYWVNGLISGISTHVTYIVGNTLLAAEKAGPETALASAIGSLRANLGRTGERVHLGEVGAQFGAAIREAPAAIQASLEAYRSGGTTMLPGEAARPRMPLQGDTSLAVSRGMTNAHVTWSELRGDVYSTLQGMRDGIVAGADLVSACGVPGAPLMGWQYSPGQQIPDLQIRGINAVPLGTLARLPSRNVAAIHSGQRAMNYSMEINRLAYRQAFEEGLTGTPLASRIADIRQNPSEEMMEQARKVSTDLTLMGPAGKWVEALSNWVNKPITLPLLGETPILKFVDPFVHIAANIMNQSLMQRTPIGLFSSEIRADLRGANGNVAADTTAAKMIVGTGLALTFGGLAAQGLASGSGPSDPNKAAMWRLAGNQAHSVRVGDMWYAVNRLGPMGMLMSVAADMYDVSHQIGKEDADVVGKSLMHAFTQNILDESFMRGPADLIKALTEPDHYGSGYVRNFLSSFIPYSVGMAQMARASDPYSRQARTIMDAIRVKVPGLSESLFPRRDIWGTPMPSGNALVSAGVTAIYAQQMSADPVNQAMLSMSVNPAPVERQIRNVHLTDQQYDDFARIAGHAAKMRLDTIVRSADFQSWPPATRHEVMDEVIRQSRESARGWMMAKYPEIPKEAAKAQITRRTGGMGQQ